MRRSLQYGLTGTSGMFAGLALLFALLEVVHLSQRQGQSTGHFAGVFAVQALALTAVFAAGAVAARRQGDAVRAGNSRP